MENMRQQGRNDDDDDNDNDGDDAAADDDDGDDAANFGKLPEFVASSLLEFVALKLIETKRGSTKLVKRNRRGRAASCLLPGVKTVLTDALKGPMKTYCTFSLVGQELQFSETSQKQNVYCMASRRLRLSMQARTVTQVYPEIPKEDNRVLCVLEYRLIANRREKIIIRL